MQTAVYTAWQKACIIKMALLKLDVVVQSPWKAPKRER